MSYCLCSTLIVIDDFSSTQISISETDIVLDILPTNLNYQYYLLMATPGIPGSTRDIYLKKSLAYPPPVRVDGFKLFKTVTKITSVSIPSLEMDTYSPQPRTAYYVASSSDFCVQSEIIYIKDVNPPEVDPKALNELFYSSVKSSSLTKYIPFYHDSRGSTNQASLF